MIGPRGERKGSREASSDRAFDGSGKAPDWRDWIGAALAEDIRDGDRTTAWTVASELEGEAVVVAKSDLVVSGIEPALEVFRRLDRGIASEVQHPDGARVGPETVVLTLRGRLAPLLTGERTALNLLQRLSGTATLTRRFVDAVDGTGAEVVDTRKTTPGWRALEKAAVRHGGGTNHRIGLFDGVLVKDNHERAAGGVGAAVRAVLGRNTEGLPVQVEVSSLPEALEAVEAGARSLLLDNMEVARLRSVVEELRRRPETLVLEASGNVTLERVRAVAETGVDRISVGALTHSAPAADLSMRVRQVDGRREA